jgi:hypothetical protein
MLHLSDIKIFSDGSVSVVNASPVEPPVNPADRFGVANWTSLSNWWLDPAYSNWSNMPMTNKQCDSGNTNSRGRNIPVSESLWKFVEQMNDAAGFRFCASVGRMIINRPYMRNGVYHDVDAGEPQNDPDNADPQAMAEPVIYPANVYKIIGETATHYRVEAFYHGTDFSKLDPLVYNWVKMPWLFPKACAENRQGVVQNVMNGIDAFWVTLCNGEAWIPKNELALPPDPTKYVINGQRGIGYRVRGANWYMGLADGSQVLVRQVTKSAGVKEFYNWRLGARSVVPPSWFV